MAGGTKAIAYPQKTRSGCLKQSMAFAIAQQEGECGFREKGSYGEADEKR